MNYGQSKSTVSLTAAEAEAACHSLDSRQANQQDIQYAQAQGSDCCQCGWSTDGATYPTDNPRQGCAEYNKCSWSNMWNAWCVADTGKSAFTIVEVILQTTSLTPLIARFMGSTWAHLGPTGPRWAPCWSRELCYLGHWGRGKMSTILQTTFPDAFSRMQSFVFWLIFHWSLFLRIQLTIPWHWFR